MSAHPSTHQEIALLRHEERLVRAALAHGHPAPVDGVRLGRPTRDLERLLEVVWALSRRAAWQGSCTRVTATVVMPLTADAKS